MHQYVALIDVSNSAMTPEASLLSIFFFLPGLLPSPIPSQNTWKGNLLFVFKKICTPVSWAVDPFAGMHGIPENSLHTAGEAEASGG